jgi:hypothetical protein
MLLIIINNVHNYEYIETGYRSLHRESLQAGRSKYLSLSSSRVMNLYYLVSSRPVLGSTQLRIQLVPGNFTLGMKRQGREAEHSSTTSSDVKKMWVHTSIYPYVFIA